MKIKKYLYLLIFCFWSTILYSQVGINTNYTEEAFIIDGKGDNPLNANPNTIQADNDFVVAKNGNVGLGVEPSKLSAKLNISSTDTALKSKGLIKLEGGNIGQVLGSGSIPGFVEWRHTQGTWVAQATNGNSSVAATSIVSESPVYFNAANLSLITPSVGAGNIALNSSNELEITTSYTGTYRITLSGVAEISATRVVNLYGYFIAGYFGIYKNGTALTIPHTIGNLQINDKVSFGYTFVTSLTNADKVTLRMRPEYTYSNIASDITFRVELMKH